MSVKNTALEVHVHDVKRNLIDNLENLRHAPAKKNQASREGLPYTAWLKCELIEEIRRLQKEAEQARANCELLEDNLRQMEDKALAAIREAGELKAHWKRCTAGSDASLINENVRLDLMVHGKQNENTLLTEALIASENEIAHLTRALSLAMQKIM